MSKTTVNQQTNKQTQIIQPVIEQQSDRQQSAAAGSRPQLWTAEQSRAITADGSDILVSAGAGAGKTAVLVERIIRKIVDEQQPMDIDRLLIVTFTKAAAAEMKDRISKAILKELDNKPLSEHLHRQLNLVSQASIDTLHAFCLDVIKKYCYKTDLDPAFRMGEENEIKLLRQEVMEGFLEQCYRQQDNELFLKLVDCYGGERGDDQLQQMLFALYDYSVSHPYPETWLTQAAEKFNLAQDAEVDQLQWIMVIKQSLAIELEEMALNLGELAEQAQSGGGLACLDDLLKESDMLNKAAAMCSGSWDKLGGFIKTIAFARMKTSKNDDLQLREEIKKVRGDIRKYLTDITEFYFRQSSEQLFIEQRLLYPYARLLAQLTCQFADCYHERKNRLAILDFNDLEHYCLRILTQSAGNRSEEAGQLLQQYDEIYVDEYQDINNVQETILGLLANDNMFMVGDVKQSIYRFRLADSGLFTEKYCSDDGTIQKVDLVNNFRSRSEILDAVNFIFRQIMNSRVGEINYDRRAEIICGADYPETEQSSLAQPVEVLLIDSKAAEKSLADNYIASDIDDIDTDYSEEQKQSSDNQWNESDYINKLALEAQLTALRIKSLMQLDPDSGQPYVVFDKQADCYRSVCYRDIVILLKTANKTADIFLNQLSALDIPAYADLNNGWFSAAEIGVMISLLQIIDNPLQDIALAAVLCSPLGDFENSELAEIRLLKKDGFFYSALCLATEKAQQQVTADQNRSADSWAALIKKVHGFLVKLDSWRTMSRRQKLGELINELIHGSGYFDYVGGLPGGKQRQANLLALADMAESFQAINGQGLYEFLQYLDKLKDNKQDLAAARTIGENEDVVRIMSIHKSKGLEFPIVFLADCGHHFNMSDLNDNVLIHKNLGLGLDVINPDLGYKYSGLAKLAIKEQIRSEMLAEEMRVLYVAMTRAREKLIISGTVRNLQTKLIFWSRNISFSEQLLPAGLRRRAAGFLDWIVPALFRHRQGDVLRQAVMTDILPAAAISTDKSRWAISLCFEIPPFVKALSDKAKSGGNKLPDNLKSLSPVNFSDSSDNKAVQYLQWRYRYDKWQKPAKLSVTEIKHLFSDNQEQNETYYDRQAEFSLRRPVFMQKKEMNAAEYGTALHLFLRHIDLTKTTDFRQIKLQLASLVNKNILTEEQANIINIKSILNFAAGPLGKRLSAADRQYRELPFCLAVSAADIWPELDDDGFNHEKIVVQGEIDCLFRENGKWVLVDYKTDRLNNYFDAPFDSAFSEREAIDKVRSRYSGQLRLYSLAIQKIFKVDIAEKYIYLFSADKIIAVD